MDEFLSDWLAVREPADLPLDRQLSSNASDMPSHRSRCRAWPRSLHGHRIEPALPDGHLPGRQRGSRRIATRVSSRSCQRTEAWADGRGYSMRTQDRGFPAVDVVSARSRRGRWISIDSSRPLRGRNLVTASALLDLVSESWLRARCHVTVRRVPLRSSRYV